MSILYIIGTYVGAWLVLVLILLWVRKVLFGTDMFGAFHFTKSFKVVYKENLGYCVLFRNLPFSNKYTSIYGYPRVPEWYKWYQLKITTEGVYQLHYTDSPFGYYSTEKEAIQAIDNIKASVKPKPQKPKKPLIKYY